MSETLVQQPAFVDLISAHRNTPAIEVIDVDDLYGDDVQILQSRSPGPSTRRLTHMNASQDIIDVDDIDEDIQIVDGPSSSHNVNVGNGQENRRRPSRRSLFSPPPRIQDNVIPPVPPLPVRFREPPPLRYRPPQDFAAGVFRPMDRPFSFESEPSTHEPGVELRAAPRSDARPADIQVDRRRNMGLGGAVLMLNRQRQVEEERTRIREETNAWEDLGVNALGLIRDLFRFGDARLQDSEDIINRLSAPRRRAFVSVPDRLQRNAPVEYRTVYTHPLKPDSGFSNDFAPPDPVSVDQPGPSSVAACEAGTILVCAKCLDPLVMNVSGTEDAVRRSRLWALRCGHMLDGKCIDEIMKPRPIPETTVEATLPPSTTRPLAYMDDADTERGDVAEQMTTARLDKGKRKADALDSTDLPVDKKGKGRAQTVQQEESSVIVEVPSVASSSSTIPQSILTRLRPRKPLLQVLETSVPETNTRTDMASATEGILNDEEVGPTQPLTRTIRGRRRGVIRGRGRGRGGRGGKPSKGKEKAKAYVVEAEHEWLCPVSSCQHKHWSVLIDGIWKMDDERELGAVALYV